MIPMLEAPMEYSHMSLSNSLAQCSEHLEPSKETYSCLQLEDVKAILAEMESHPINVDHLLRDLASVKPSDRGTFAAVILDYLRDNIRLKQLEAEITHVKYSQTLKAVHLHQMGVVRLQADLASLKAAGAVHGRTIEDAEDEVGDIEDEVGDIEDEVGDIEDEVGDIEDEVGDIEDEIHDAKLNLLDAVMSSRRQHEQMMTARDTALRTVYDSNHLAGGLVRHADNRFNIEWDRVLAAGIRQHIAMRSRNEGVYGHQCFSELLPTIPQLQTYDEIPNYPRTVEEAQRACIELRAT